MAGATFSAPPVHSGEVLCGYDRLGVRRVSTANDATSRDELIEAEVGLSALPAPREDHVPRRRG